MNVDWHELFSLSLPLGEIVARGTIFYGFLLVLFRFVVRREFITEDELLARLRESGVESLRQVKHAYMETNGQISVIVTDH